MKISENDEKYAILHPRKRLEPWPPAQIKHGESTLPTDLQALLETYRSVSQTEREKGSYFEQLVKTYLLNEPSYKDLFGGEVYLWEEWRREWMRQGNDDPGADAGIDLVAVKDAGNDPETFAIQAKFYAEGTKVTKRSIDSFLSAMGKPPFKKGLLFLTSTEGTTHAQHELAARDKPVNIVTLSDLEKSQIDWSKYQPDISPTLRPKKDLRLDQKTAVSNVLDGLANADRGKLIMACGTGKTFVSLKIAEKVAGAGGRVLFLVPSLALLSQTLTEWTQESGIPLHNFAVCSDSDVGKKKRSNNDDVQMLMHELRYPATTKPDALAREMKKRHDNQHLSVVYGTYHSIDVISKAQKEHKLPKFDLIICDEAHRTTGATWESEDESHFVKVHDSSFIKAEKRLYMTATPRVYGHKAEAKAEKEGVVLYSMDNREQFGKVLHALTFSDAVGKKLLCDYKVIILAVDKAHVSSAVQNALKDEDNSLKVDDAARIVGSWKALAKLGLEEDVDGDTNPMRRAVAFCQVIDQYKGVSHKVSSKQIAGEFAEVVKEYQEFEAASGREHGTLKCEAEHVDGTMNASQKEQKINWLKEDVPENTCRILSNVRCLSEGVDVPALDAVLFLSPRNSQVDVVQSVGRVMRTAPGKQRGYVVLPVVIPEGVEPNKALNDNKTYKVVWDVLQALRSHNDRFDADINKLEINGELPSRIEVVAVTEDFWKKSAASKERKGARTARGRYKLGVQTTPPGEIKEQMNIQYELGIFERALYAKIVKKCGNRQHWEDWADDIAKIAETHATRIRAIVSKPENKKEVKAFSSFVDELRDDLNDSITEGEVIEMLAQHLITKPVFDALFEDYSFASKNPVSQAMQKVLDVLQEHRLEKEADTLEQFYKSVKMRAEGINNAEGKQKIMVELYDKFFRNAFPQMTERLGIVYTPVEVVDFIIHSVNDLLQQEFGQTLGSEGVHIVDPFTGTGTFISRLLQSGLISKEQLPHKYRSEIHANEIVLLAYYIAAINIEATYHTVMNEGVKVGGHEYQSFEGICLTDTFQMYEKDDLISELMEDNSDRRKRQKGLDIRVIMSNPPYSAGQRSANDNNANLSYPSLDERIRVTYAAGSSAKLKNALYDSYIRAIRWASDRLCKNRTDPQVDFASSECVDRCRCNGVIGFVTNAGFVEGSAADGLRKCVAEEFSNIHIVHLRGNIRKNMGVKGGLGEGENVFGQGSMAGIAISFLVRNQDASEFGRIYVHDIGDNLKREQKLEKISTFTSVKGIGNADWTRIRPDEHGDWLNQRDASFHDHIAMGGRKSDGLGLFENYSNGVKTQRDAWCCNYSNLRLGENVSRMIDFYNSELRKFNKQYDGLTTKERAAKVDGFIDTDPQRISWTSALKQDFSKGYDLGYAEECLVQCHYRPFSKQHLYYNRRLNERVFQMPRIFPLGEVENLVIQVNTNWRQAGQIAIISNTLPDLHCNGDSQCFPRFIYDEAGALSDEDAGLDKDLFSSHGKSSKGNDRICREAITDGGLQHFLSAYPGEKITKEDIFYYVYGLLHSSQYQERFSANLSKELPRIPCVKTAQGFWGFSKAGRELAHWHLNYETVDPYPAMLEGVEGKKAKLPPKEMKKRYRVTKMKHPKVDGEDGKKVNDLTTVIYNEYITVKGIPEEAYDYVVNGKPAIEWVIDRQCVKTDKASGIVNDANDWAIETMNDPKYPLELLLRVITVSLETNKIVANLPDLDID